jgi:prevent-host-death family protein
MTIYVNIGEAKTRLSQLVAAAVRGEEIIVAKAGEPQVRLTPVAARTPDEIKRIAEKRRKAIGMFARECAGMDLSIETLRADRPDPEERFRRKFGTPD